MKNCKGDLPSPAKRPKIAIACPGVGLVQRGFERMMADIYHLVRDSMDVTLFKGGGPPTEHEIVLRFLPRNGWVARHLPVHRLAGRTAIHLECLTFGLALLWRIRSEHFDVVHCTDPPLARFLYKLRRILGMKFKLLYSEACAMPASDYPPADHIHQISAVTLDDALRFGLTRSYMTLIPLGIFPERFESLPDRASLRELYGIAPSTFVVVSIAAIDRRHKRIDYLIDEVASLDGDILLWIDGSLDQGDATLVDYARERLGARCRITHMRSEEVRNLYGLADVFVHASLFEAFGLAMVEAAIAGAPLLVHNADHFRWLIPNENCWVDMSAAGALAGRLESLRAAPEELDSRRLREVSAARFDWRVLKSEYLGLYERVASLENHEIGIAESFGLQ